LFEPTKQPTVSGCMHTSNHARIPVRPSPAEVPRIVTCAVQPGGQGVHAWHPAAGPDSSPYLQAVLVFLHSCLACTVVVWLSSGATAVWHPSMLMYVTASCCGCDLTVRISTIV
jgi:hypothetical protein